MRIVLFQPTNGGMLDFGAYLQMLHFMRSGVTAQITYSLGDEIVVGNIVASHPEKAQFSLLVISSERKENVSES